MRIEVNQGAVTVVFICAMVLLALTLTYFSHAKQIHAQEQAFEKAYMLRLQGIAPVDSTQVETP